MNTEVERMRSDVFPRNANHENINLFESGQELPERQACIHLCTYELLMMYINMTNIAQLAINANLFILFTFSCITSTCQLLYVRSNSDEYQIPIDLPYEYVGIPTTKYPSIYGADAGHKSLATKTWSDRHERTCRRQQQQ